MTTVTFFRRESVRGAIEGVRAVGHTGYADEGSDIVCAGLSALLVAAVNGLERVAGVKPSVEQSDGLLEVFLPARMTERQAHDCATILDTLHGGIADLAATYSRYVKTEETVK